MPVSPRENCAGRWHRGAKIAVHTDTICAFQLLWLADLKFLWLPGHEFADNRANIRLNTWPQSLALSLINYVLSPSITVSCAMTTWSIHAIGADLEHRFK